MPYLYSGMKIQFSHRNMIALTNSNFMDLSYNHLPKTIGSKVLQESNPGQTEYGCTRFLPGVD
jgi:hypothetical protein